MKYMICYRTANSRRILKNVRNISTRPSVLSSAYGRVLARKILRAFPDDLCRSWLIHSKRENMAESNISVLMTFLNEEVKGALTAGKIRGEVSFYFDLTPTAATLHVHSNQKRCERKTKKPTEPFCLLRRAWPLGSGLCGDPGCEWPHPEA
jgi:hypothetical protein